MEAANLANDPVLSGADFTKLQLYVAASCVLPGSPESWWDVYPFRRFAFLDIQRHEYDMTIGNLMAIRTQCSNFNDNAANSINDLSNIPDEVGPLLESLNKRMDVVCDRGIPQGSQRGRDARDDARGQLHEMKARIKTVVDKCEAVANVMDKFLEEAKKQEAPLWNAVNTLEKVTSTSAVDEVLAHWTEKWTDHLLRIAKDQDEAKSQDWSLVDDVWRAVGSESTAAEKLEKLRGEYEEGLRSDSQQREEVYSDLSLVRRLRHSVGSLAENIDGALASLRKIKSALGLMTAKCKETVTKLEDLDGCVIRDELPSRRRAESFVKSASKAWNLVLRVAREFPKHDFIAKSHVVEVPLIPQEDNGLKLLAAYYGGQDVMRMARLCFSRHDSFFIDSSRIPVMDPLPGKNKCLSLVYTCGSNSEMRVFYGDASQGQKWTLTSGLLTEQPQWVTVAAAHWSDKHSPNLRIHAVVYGMTQVIDRAVYDRLYEYLAKEEGIYISNDLFGGDSWYGVTKSAAIVYEVDGQMKSMGGVEGEKVSWVT